MPDDLEPSPVSSRPPSPTFTPSPLSSQGMVAQVENGDREQSLASRERTTASPPADRSQQSPANQPVDPRVTSAMVNGAGGEPRGNSASSGRPEDPRRREPPMSMADWVRTDGVVPARRHDRRPPTGSGPRLGTLGAVARARTPHLDLWWALSQPRSNVGTGRSPEQVTQSQSQTGGRALGGGGSGSGGRHG